MYCSSCGKQIPDDSVFCPECGNKLQVAVAQQPRTDPSMTAPPAPPEQADRTALAEFSDRFLAGLLDGLILLIPNIIANQIIAFFGMFFVSVPYYLYFMSDKGGGQTLGYKAMKLRLMDESKRSPVSVGTVALWYLVLAIAGIISWIWYFSDENRRMLHNIASKTIVVSLKRIS